MKGLLGSLLLWTSTVSLVWGQEQQTDVAVSNQNTTSTTTSCSLLGLVPFDYPVRSKQVPYKSYQLPQLLDGNATEAPPPYAVTHAAAALLAVDHFNARDNSLVPALQEYTSDCSLTIDDLVIANTQNKEGVVPRIIYDYVFERGGKTPCAVLGGYSDGPTREAAVVANGMKTVTITHGSEDPRLGGAVNPDTTQMCSNQHPTGEAIANWLRSKGRTDFLTILHTSQEYAITFGDAVNNAAVESNFTSVEQKRVGPPYDGSDPNDSFLLSLQEIKKSTWKTIVVILTRYNLPPTPTLPILADAAEALKMNGDDFVWVFVLPDHQTLGEFVEYSSNTSMNTSKLVQGSAVVRSLDDATLPDSSFQKVWKEQDESFVERLNQLLPKKYAGLPPNYFQQYLPEAGAGYMYDSVMVAAMGKCQEAKLPPPGPPSGGKGGGGGKPNGGQEGGQGGKPNGSQGGGQGGGQGNNRNDVDRRSRRLRRSHSEDERKTKRKLQKSGPELSPHMKGITSLDFEGVTGRINYNDGNPRRIRNRNRKLLSWGVYNIREVDPQQKEQMELQFNQTFS